MTMGPLAGLTFMAMMPSDIAAEALRVGWPNPQGPQAGRRAFHDRGCAAVAVGLTTGQGLEQARARMEDGVRQPAAPSAFRRTSPRPRPK